MIKQLFFLYLFRIEQHTLKCIEHRKSKIRLIVVWIYYFIRMFVLSKTLHLRLQWRALMAEWPSLLTSDHKSHTAHMSWIPDTHILYDRKAQAVMVNSSININKTNNHFSPQIQKDTWHWKSNSRLETG
jgi:hypothetical protein